MKGLGDGMVCSPRGAVRVHPQSPSTTRERYRITSIPSMHRAGAPRGPSPNPPVLPGRWIGGLYGLLARIGGLEWRHCDIVTVTSHQWSHSDFKGIPQTFQTCHNTHWQLFFLYVVMLLGLLNELQIMTHCDLCIAFTSWTMLTLVHCPCVLTNRRSGGGFNRGFRVRDSSVMTCVQERAALTYFYGKRKVLANGLSMAPLEVYKDTTTSRPIIHPHGSALERSIYVLRRWSDWLR